MTPPPPSRPIRVAAVQLRIGPNPDENLRTAQEAIRDAGAAGAALAVLPELFRSPYFCQEEDPAYFALAEPVPGPTTEALAAAARGVKVAVIATVFERRAPGVYHNTAVVIDEQGTLLARYRKLHVPEDPKYDEKFYFAPGDLPVPVVPVVGCRVSPLVCWDQWFPEAARLAGLGGAELIAYPSAIGWHPTEKSEFGSAQYDAWLTMHRAHAIANGVYVAAVNRVGTEHAEVDWPSPSPPFRHDAVGDGLEFWGGSAIVDPFGRVVVRASADEPEILYADVDPAVVERTRQHWPFWRDRRIDAYEPLLRRFGPP